LFGNVDLKGQRRKREGANPEVISGDRSTLVCKFSREESNFQALNFSRVLIVSLDPEPPPRGIEPWQR
jgi:hypothetical protein